jgi:hypothetical protein
VIVRYSCDCIAFHVRAPGGIIRSYCLVSCDAGRDPRDPSITLYERPGLIDSANRGEKTWAPVSPEDSASLMDDLGKLVVDGLRARQLVEILGGMGLARKQ